MCEYFPLPTVCCPLQAALKKYQMEHKSKGESLEKCQAELKKLRRKSQGSKHPSKYGDKEMRVSSRPPALFRSPLCEGGAATLADLARCSLCWTGTRNSAALTVLELTPTHNLLLLVEVRSFSEGRSHADLRGGGWAHTCRGLSEQCFSAGGWRPTLD